MHRWLMDEWNNMIMTRVFTNFRMTQPVLSLGFLAMALAGPAQAEQEQPGATPFRPTVTSGANISMPGWLELEFGGQRLGGNGADQRNSWPYLLKYSVNERFALLIGGDAYVSVAPAQSVAFNGQGDTTLTLKYRAPEAPEGSSFGIEATVKLPTAMDGIGSGERDYSLKAIYGVDLPNELHLDTNLMTTRLGAVATNQGRYQWAWAAAVSRQFGDKWTLAGDLSGTGQAGSPSTAQFLSALSYALTRRVVLDAGFAAGLNSSTPSFNVFAGMTMLIGKIN
jgi:hypothetical protein